MLVEEPKEEAEEGKPVKVEIYNRVVKVNYVKENQNNNTCPICIEDFTSREYVGVH